MILSELISPFISANQWYNSQPSIHTRTAVTESLLLRVLLTPSKALLRLSKEKIKSARPLFTLQDLNKPASVKIWQKRPFLYYLVQPGHRQAFHLGGSEGLRNVQIEKQPFCQHYEHLLLEKDQELAQGLYDVNEYLHGPPGPEVGVDEALLVEEGHLPLFALGQKGLGLDGDRMAHILQYFL